MTGNLVNLVTYVTICESSLNDFFWLFLGELLSVKEYHSLLCLLCYDFPLDMVQKTARIVLMDDALDCLMAFPDFLYAFQIQFYYEGNK